VRWRDGVLEVDRPYERDVDLGGRGLLLVPAAFAWPRVFAMFDEPWQPALIYTPRRLGSLWGPRGRGGAGGAPGPRLARRGARLPATLALPAATTALARRLGASPAGVSE